MNDFQRASKRKASLVATIKAVLWSFFGVRKKSDYESDSTNLNPIHVVVAGVIGAVLFIVILLIVVRFVTSN